jgi:hypothetical protein
MVTQPRITVGTYNQVLATYLVPGLVGGAGLVVWGAFQEKLMVRLITLLVGILPIWSGSRFRGTS